MARFASRTRGGNGVASGGQKTVVAVGVGSIDMDGWGARSQRLAGGLRRAIAARSAISLRNNAI